MHVVQRGGDVAHHGHEEEGHLEHRVLEKVQTADDAFIPVGIFHADKQGEDP